MKKVFLLTLGCPRNLTDSEVLQASLEKKGYAFSESAENSDIAIVNTCGFIQEAKEESIDMILGLANLKKEKKLKKLIVTGCLSQRYPSQLMDEIDEIDGLFGSSDFTRIPELISVIESGERIKKVSMVPDFIYNDTTERKYLTPSHYAYIKIQEGCVHRCTFCIIPDLRGPLRSRSSESILIEAKKMRNDPKIKEVILVGQDTTSYGIDINGKPTLAPLLREVSRVLDNKWVRLLYAHPQYYTDELIETVASSNNVCKYIDIPVQHISDRILKDMARGIGKEETITLIRKIRRDIKDSVIRTSIIVGFPGETDADFTELIDFLKETKFDRLGAFTYSKEDGTKAYTMKKQVPEKIKNERYDILMNLQKEISARNNTKFIGRELKVLIDEKIPDADNEYIGRSFMDSPEVDGSVYVRGAKARVGEFADVRITGTMEYDLVGECL